VAAAVQPVPLVFPAGRRHLLEAAAMISSINVSVASVLVGPRLRSIDQTKVDALAESIRTIGLQHPISIYQDDLGRPHLVAGAHRLEAVKKLGIAGIDAIVVELLDIDRKLWEIAENLHRAELTALERDQHVAEWIRLTDSVSAQHEPKLSKRGRKSEGRPASGINKASREIGVSRQDAQRAVRVANLTDEAKAEAVKLGLDDNRTALLKAAKGTKPHHQVQALRDYQRSRRDKAGREARYFTHVVERLLDLTDIHATEADLDLSKVTPAQAGEWAATLTEALPAITERITTLPDRFLARAKQP
jgi:ParB-like chromosome segregation protein Spo0J